MQGKAMTTMQPARFLLPFFPKAKPEIFNWQVF